MVFVDKKGNNGVLVDGANLYLANMRYVNTSEAKVCPLAINYEIVDEKAYIYQGDDENNGIHLNVGDEVSIIDYCVATTEYAEFLDEAVVREDIDNDGKKETIVGNLPRGVEKTRKDQKMTDSKKVFIGFLKSGTSITSGYKGEKRTFNGDQACFLLRNKDGGYSVLNLDNSKTPVNSCDIQSITTLEEYINNYFRYIKGKEGR